MEFIVNSKIKVFANTDEISEFLGNFWIAKINELKEGEHYTIALSGGNTPIKIFKYLSEHFNNSIEWNKVTFFWGDERCVPPNDSDSNYKLAVDNLFSKINFRDKNIFRIKGEADPQQEVIAYSKVLEDNLEKLNGAPKFDFILLGLGEDGHTASIFPNEIELFNSTNNCEVATHPISGQKRISITGKIINNAETVSIVGVGNNKAKVVSEILNKSELSKNYPVSLVNPESGNLIWLLDEVSAKMI